MRLLTYDSTQNTKVLSTMLGDSRQLYSWSLEPSLYKCVVNRDVRYDDFMLNLSECFVSALVLTVVFLMLSLSRSPELFANLIFALNGSVC